MDPNGPGSSNAPANADVFGRNPDGTVVTHVLPPDEHIASVRVAPKASVTKKAAKKAATKKAAPKPKKG